MSASASDNWVTAHAAAALLGLTRQMIFVLVARGVLRSRIEYLDSRTHRVVLLGDVEAELQRRRARALRTALGLGVSE